MTQNEQRAQKGGSERHRLKVIGITGGVGAGKSEVLKLLEECSDSCILKADEAAHEVENRECRKKLTALLSEDILSGDGTIDKRRMAEKIFADESLLEKVNAIVHPAVKSYILSRIEEERKKGEADYFFIEAALLIEDGYELICDELWYVYADEDVRRKRLKGSRGYCDEKTDSIMKAQNTDEVFRNHCSVVIDNSGDLSDTKRQIMAILSERHEQVHAEAHVPQAVRRRPGCE